MIRRRMTYGRADKDVAEFIAAASITDYTQKKAISYLVKGLKDANLWGKFAVIYPFVGGTPESHKWNLKNTAKFNMTWGVGHVHDEYGVKPNRSYNNTGATTNDIISGRDFHISLYVRTNIRSLKVFDVGQSVTQSGVRISCHLGWDEVIYFDVGYAPYARAAAGVSDIRGLLCLNNISNVMSISRNGIKIGSTTAPGVIPNLPFYFNSQDSVNTDYNTRVFSLMTLGSGLTDSNQTAFNNVVQQYQNILNRKV